MAQRKEVDISTSGVLQFPTQVAGGPSLLSTLERLSIVEREVVLSLGSQSDAEILNTRKRAKIAGRFAWRIEVACDAQVVTRAEDMRGKARRMTSHSGVMAAVKKRAREIGCTPNTILQNSRIFKLIQEAESITNNENSFNLQIFDEKSFFIAALSAKDPLGALKLFSEKKRTEKRFRVSDAFRLLERLGLSKKQKSIQTVQKVKDSVIDLTSSRKKDIQHIVDTINLIQTRIIPLSKSHEVTLIHESYVQELGEYLQYDLLGVEVAANLSLSEVIKAWESSK